MAGITRLPSSGQPREESSATKHSRSQVVYTSFALFVLLLWKSNIPHHLSVDITSHYEGKKSPFAWLERGVIKLLSDSCHHHNNSFRFQHKLSTQLYSLQVSTSQLIIERNVTLNLLTSSNFGRIKRLSHQQKKNAKRCEICILILLNPWRVFLWDHHRHSSWKERDILDRHQVRFILQKWHTKLTSCEANLNSQVNTKASDKKVKILQGSVSLLQEEITRTRLTRQFLSERKGLCTRVILEVDEWNGSATQSRVENRYSIIDRHRHEDAIQEKQDIIHEPRWERFPSDSLLRWCLY